MQPLDRLDGPILAYGPRDPLNQFLVVGLHQLGLAFCLLVDHDIHRNLFPCFSLAHLEDVQNQTSIFDNHSTTLCSRASIITIRQRPFFSAFADMLDFSSREEPVVREHGTCQTDNKQTIRRSEEEKTMKIKRLGRTGLKISEICLGTMTFGNQCDEPTSRAIMDKAFDYGVTFFDTADAYPIGGALESMGRTEEYIGNWLKGDANRLCWRASSFSRWALVPMIVAGRASISSRRPMLACAVCRPTISICIRCIFPILKRRSMRRSGRWMTWFIAAKCAISAAPTIPPGC